MRCFSSVDDVLRFGAGVDKLISLFGPREKGGYSRTIEA
jgi:hypothetical protein